LSIVDIANSRSAVPAWTGKLCCHADFKPTATRGATGTIVAKVPGDGKRKRSTSYLRYRNRPSGRGRILPESAYSGANIHEVSLNGKFGLFITLRLVNEELRSNLNHPFGNGRKPVSRNVVQRVLNKIAPYLEPYRASRKKAAACLRLTESVGIK